MKTLSLSICLSFALLSNVIAQEFSPGYYIIQSSAKYAVLSPSYSDYNVDENGIISYPDYNNIFMGKGEVVIAFDYYGGKVYCFDPKGRMLVFDALTNLIKAPIVEGCGVGLMSGTIELIDGNDLQESAFYWIIGQDISKSTIKIQINDNKIYDVPASKISLYTAIIKKYSKSETMKSVE